MFTSPSLSLLGAFALLAARVTAHGVISGATADGVTNKGPNVYYEPAAENKLTAVRTMYRADSPSYVLPGSFSDASAMACEGAAGAPASLTVKAGDSVTVEWTGATSELLGIGGVTDRNPWVHAMGTIIDYIAPCNGKCSTTDASSLGWTKLAEAGLDTSQTISSDLRDRMTSKPEPYYPTAAQGAGLWAMAKMVQDGSTWSINVPKALQDGEYILRTEMGAIHNPKNSNPTSGPQLYIGCIQVTVTNGGSTTLPAGTKASDLIDPNGDYANFNVYSSPYGLKMPGPAVWDGASSGAADPAPATTSAAPAASSSAPAPEATTSSAPEATTSATPAPEATPSSASEAAPAPTTQIAVVTSASAAAPSATACKTRGGRRRRAVAGRAHGQRRMAAHEFSL